MGLSYVLKLHGTFVCRPVTDLSVIYHCIIIAHVHSLIPAVQKNKPQKRKTDKYFPCMSNPFSLTIHFNSDVPVIILPGWGGVGRIWGREIFELSKISTYQNQ